MSSLQGVGTVVAWSPYIEISACEVQAAEYPLAFAALLSGIEDRSHRMPDTLQQDQAEFDRRDRHGPVSQLAGRATPSASPAALPKTPAATGISSSPPPAAAWPA